MGTDDGQGVPGTNERRDAPTSGVESAVIAPGVDQGAATAPTAVAAPTAGLQFDHVELASPEAARLCGRCQRPIADEYFEIAGRVICRQCAADLGGGAGKGAFPRALVFGGAAALVGTLVWYAIVKITSYELGLIAVGVGLFVGVAVQKGARGRGGWKYQALAILLTYASITASKIPFIVTAIRERAAAREVNAGGKAKVTDATVPGAAASGETSDMKRGKVDNLPMGTSPGGDEPVKPNESARRENKHEGNDTATAKDSPGLASLLLAFIFLFGLALASPFLAGAQNIMGIIIIAIALYEAWKMNRRAPISGPFRLGQPATSAAVPVPAGDAPSSAPTP